MKKRFISIITILLSFCLLFNGISISAAESFKETEKEMRYCYYDAKTDKVSRYTKSELLNKLDISSEKNTVKDSMEYLCDEEYVPNNMSIEEPPQMESRLLLGTWSEVGDTTVGQHRNTVLITYTKDEISYRASGFMIGPAAVATCGHVLYSDGNYADNIRVFPARDGDTNPYGSSEYSSFLVNEGWTVENDSNYDWGIILLETNIGNNVGWLGLETKTSSYDNQSITVSGYPGGFGGAMYKSNGTISSSAQYKLYSVNTNINGGMSGGPVYYYNSNSGYTAIGIVMGATQTKNSFIRLTREVYDLFVEYRNYSV